MDKSRTNLDQKQKTSSVITDKRGFMVGEGGFEPPKALPADLQSVPFGHSGIPPYMIWSWWTDSNPRPADYKSAALPTELHQHHTSSNIITNGA